MSKYPKLNPVIKEKILNALRSGKYKYCKGYLFEHVEDEEGNIVGAHCALGVIYNTFGVNNDKLHGQSNLWVKDLPEHIRSCIGMFAYSLQGIDYVGEQVFSRNDRHDSYEAAAKWIEDNL